MSPFARASIGALGGFAAWLSKLLALDAVTLGQLVEQQLWSQATEMKVSILIILPALVFLGALIAWLTDETLRIKLFAIGVSAPAIIAPWTARTEVPDLVALDGLAIVGQAHAQVYDRKQPTGMVDGLKVLFGLTPIPDPATERYWVIAGSFADLDQAYAFAAEINRRNPELEAFVGSRAPGNPLFPVIVGGTDAYLSLEGAKLLQEKADAAGLGTGGAYLSAYPDRVPDDTSPR